MPSALSSPRPAARISRAKSTPPRPMKCWAVIRLWNSFMTPSTSSDSTLPRRISSRVSDSTSRGRSLDSRTPASSFDICARKTAAFRRPGSSGRAGAAGTAGRFAVPPIPRSCSTPAMLISPPRWRSSGAFAELLCSWVNSQARSRLVLAQPATEHRCHLVGTLADHGRDLPSYLLPLGGLELEGPVVDVGHLTAAGDPEPIELGEHVVAELERLVLLLDLLPAARAQPDQEDDEGDAGRDAAGLDHRPHLGTGLGLLGRGQVGRRLLRGRGVERHGRHGDRVAAGGVQADGVADQRLDLVLVETARDAVVH